MSFERAYKNCIDCSQWYELHRDIELASAQHINHTMNEAMKALEEERRYITQHETDCVLVDKALEACIKCDKRDAAIADLLEKAMPELFGEGTKEAEKEGGK